MRKYLLMIMIVVALVITGCTSESIDGLSGKVISVIDGDTIKVKLADGNEERVRMTLIDTPETKHPKVGVQPIGEEATEFTTAQLTDQDVVLELDVQERDQYGRLLAYVWMDGTFFNEVLIEKGYARVAVFPPNTKYVDQFRDIEEKAKSEGIGIWSIENYTQEDGYNTGVTNEEVAINGDCNGQIKGNKNSKIYHLPNGAHYNDVSEQNIVWFCTETEAKTAGYREAKR